MTRALPWNTIEEVKDAYARHQKGVCKYSLANGDNRCIMGLAIEEKGLNASKLKDYGWNIMGMEPTAYNAIGFAFDYGKQRAMKYMLGTEKSKDLLEDIDLAAAVHEALFGEGAE